MTNPEENHMSEEELKILVERIERLEDDKSAIAADIRDVYQEAKSLDFDPKVIREIIKLRKMDQDEIDEQEALLEIYKKTLGMG